MSLSSQLAPANSKAAPLVLVNPLGHEVWNYIDIGKDAVAAEVSFDSGATWVPFPASWTGWSGPFPLTNNQVLMRPADEATPVTNAFALARRTNDPEY